MPVELGIFNGSVLEADIKRPEPKYLWLGSFETEDYSALEAATEPNVTVAT